MFVLLTFLLSISALMRGHQEIERALKCDVNWFELVLGFVLHLETKLTIKENSLNPLKTFVCVCYIFNYFAIVVLQMEDTSFQALEFVKFNFL